MTAAFLDSEYPAMDGLAINSVKKWPTLPTQEEIDILLEEKKLYYPWLHNDHNKRTHDAINLKTQGGIIMRLRKVESKSDSKVELGGYTWTKVGTVGGKDLYLCDEMVESNMPFNKEKNNNWKGSDIRKWLNGPFYNSLSKEDKSKIAKNVDGDNLFCLSIEEAESIPKSIRQIQHSWWLRSPGSNTYYAAYVNPGGSVDINGYFVNCVSHGVRPAFLMNSTDKELLKELLSKVRDTYKEYKGACNAYLEAGGDEDDIEDIVRNVNKVL